VAVEKEDAPDVQAPEAQQQRQQSVAVVEAQDMIAHIAELLVGPPGVAAAEAVAVEEKEEELGAAEEHEVPPPSPPPSALSTAVAEAALDVGACRCPRSLLR
jgi:hypothetical protein